MYHPLLMKCMILEFLLLGGFWLHKMGLVNRVRSKTRRRRRVKHASYKVWILEFPYLWLKFDGTNMDGFDDPAEFLSIVSELLMILLNAHNILALASTILVESPSLEEFHVDMEEGVWHMDNIHSTSIVVLHSFQL